MQKLIADYELEFKKISGQLRPKHFLSSPRHVYTQTCATHGMRLYKLHPSLYGPFNSHRLSLFCRRNSSMNDQDTGFRSAIRTETTESPCYEAKRYEGRLQKGGILLSVHCDTAEEIDRAQNILERTGAEDISSTGESSVGTSKSDPRVRRTASGGHY